MSLEQAVLANTAAIEKLTALLATNAVATLPEKPAEKAQPAGKKASGGAAPKSDQPKRSAADIAATVENKVEEPKAPTYEETAKALKELAAAKGRNAVMELLGKYGAEKTLQEVKPEKFAALVGDAQKAVA